MFQKTFIWELLGYLDVSLSRHKHPVPCDVEITGYDCSWIKFLRNCFLPKIINPYIPEPYLSVTYHESISSWDLLGDNFVYCIISFVINLELTGLGWITRIHSTKDSSLPALPHSKECFLGKMLLHSLLFAKYMIWLLPIARIWYD